MFLWEVILVWTDWQMADMKIMMASAMYVMFINIMVPRDCTVICLKIYLFLLTFSIISWADWQQRAHMKMVMFFSIYIIFKKTMTAKYYKEMYQRMYMSLWIPSTSALMRIPKKILLKCWLHLPQQIPRNLLNISE